MTKEINTLIQSDTTNVVNEHVMAANTQQANKLSMLNDDPRFRIRPLQQVASACTGGMLTATFSKFFGIVFKNSFILYKFECFSYSDTFGCGQDPFASPTNESSK